MEKDCKPEVINGYRDFDCFDDEGNMETTLILEYNCQECDNEECKYWEKYN